MYVLRNKHFKFDNTSDRICGRFYLLQTDAVLLAACFRENLILGGSLNRAIGGATGWIELWVVSTEFFSGDVPDEEKKTFWSASAGMDRSWFNTSLYGYLEYHFNSPGANDPEDWDIAVTTPAYTAGNIYLPGRHYLSPGITWTPMPLLNISGQALTSPQQHVIFSILARC